MHAWAGWTAALATRVNTACTWEEWYAAQRRLLGGDQRHQACPLDRIALSQRELTYLSFVRWLYQTGRLDPREHDHHHEHR
jgi:hypothetical protein